MIEPETKHIAFLILPESTLLDVTGPYEVFTQAIELIATSKYRTGFNYQLHSISMDDNENIRTASGIVFHCTENIKTVDYLIDTLFIPGVPNAQAESYRLPENVLQWITEQAKHTRRICSVCTGSFFLAEAGLLSNKRVTTHWEKCEALSRTYPDIHVESEPIFIKDGYVYTSAGISSGMDLALALIEEDLGKSLALETARQMVLYLKRPGSQAQYSSVLTHQHIDHRPIQEICDWIMEHLNEIITVETLAERSLMSARNFARVFLRETGITPAKYIEKLRIETACRQLVDTHLSLKQITDMCGLGSVDNMRKVFSKNLGISPADYRKNFGTALGETK